MIRDFKDYLIFSFETKIYFLSIFCMIAYFNIWRFIFFYSYVEDFEISLFLIIKSIFYALLSDIFISFLICLPILFFCILLGRKVKKKILFVYLFLIFFVVGFWSAVDLEFFKELGTRINITAQMYGFDTGAQSGEVWVQAWVAYPVFLYFFFIFFFTFLMLKIINYKYENYSNLFLVKQKPLINFFLLIINILVLTNSFKFDSFNPRKSFISKDHMMINHLTVNNIQNYLFSLLSKPDLIFFDNNKAIQYKEEILKKNKLPKKNITLSKFNNPNVVLIILESHIGAYTNYINKDFQPSITPFLDSLSTRSINFNNCYANGNRTVYGLSSILCSYPVIPGYPLSRYDQYLDKDMTDPLTFSSVLKEINENYESIFMYGGDSNFDKMKEFANSNAFDQVIDRMTDSILDDLKLDNLHQGVNPWGVFDHYLLDRAIDVMDKNSTHNPVFLSILTTTNHLPWIVPENYKSKIINHESNGKDFNLSKNTIQYVDKSLRKFLKKAENKIWFDNTLFIITADHGLNVFKKHINDPRNGRIPFLIYNRILKENDIKIYNKCVSQIDILPTLVDLISESKYYRSSNLYGSSGFKGADGFAFRCSDNDIQWIEDNFVYNYNIGTGFEEFFILKGDNFQVTEAILSDSIKNIYEKKSKSFLQASYLDAIRLNNNKKDSK